MTTARILIVEDESIFALDLQKRIQNLDYEVVGLARNADLALEMAKNNVCDLALLDIRLNGGMDGIELAKQLESDFQIPSIYITAYSNAETLERAKATEPGAFLIKPISERELRSAIEISLYRVKMDRERRALEEQRQKLQSMLNEREKIDVVSRLSSAIAHELGNTLTGIKGNIELLRGQGLSKEENEQAFSHMEQSCERGFALIKRLLGLTQNSAFQPEIHDISEVFDRAVRSLRDALGPKIDIQKASADSLECYFDADQVEQVFIQLLLNARDALIAEGKIEVAFVERDISDDLAEEKGVPSGSYLEVVVRDNGIGIDPEQLESIFKPFFTNKRSGKEIGLGLSVVESTMERHGGWVEAHSDGSSGASFHLFFRKLPQEPEAIDCGQDEAVEQEILVIDDEQMILDIAEQFFSSEGLSCVTFADAREALDWYARNHQKISLVILDLNMPHISGETCFNRIRQLDPDARVILTSGYGENDTVHQLLDAGAIDFLKKPFDFPAVVNKVNELM